MSEQRDLSGATDTPQPPPAPSPEVMRVEYGGFTLDEATAADDPFEQFRRWFDDAVRGGGLEANAMVLATVDSEGRPRQRTVLLKGVDEAGFTFFTNYSSAKAQQIAATGQVSLLFGWHHQHRQVIVSGTAEQISAEENRRYFSRRPRGSQLAAWASRQSRELTGRSELDEAFADAARRFPDEVPVPDGWGGFRVTPVTIEFWQGRTNRLHDRLMYRVDGDGRWQVARLAP